LKRLISRPLVGYLRKWDKTASQRPDGYFAISETVKKRIKEYYGRESQVIYPPIDLKKFKLKDSQSKVVEKYFLVVGRLVPYKKVDLVVIAFNRLNWKLKIIGTGSELDRLRRIAKSNVEFLGYLTDERLLDYYQNCSAVIFPQEEDFGLVPLEAQACGKPVIAFAGGGGQETVIRGVTGEFFYPQTADSLIEVLVKLNVKKYLPENCYRQAQKFCLEEFIKIFKKMSLESQERYLSLKNFK
jgi:glycosyltransferase involved in cell wall biosynthesis